MSGNRCAFPGCPSPIVESVGTITGEICHIRARSPGGPRYDEGQDEEQRHGHGNLVLLCRRHHKVVDSDPVAYSAEALLDMKAIHEAAAGRPEQPADAFFARILLNDHRRVQVHHNSGNVAIDSPGAILAHTVNHTVNVRTTRRTVTIAAPPGTIGANQRESRYVQHLIKRYNEFASADGTRATRFSFGAISKNIETNFRAPWRLLPMEDFGRVCSYLQQRIVRTRIAKTNTSKGYPSFSTFEEFGRGDD